MSSPPPLSSLEALSKKRDREAVHQGSGDIPPSYQGLGTNNRGRRYQGKGETIVDMVRPFP
jgi:hypothetical protein